jgi:arylsulfatase A-like enzyme
MKRKPNILFFFTDDQRFDTIAGLGHPAVRTPNLDRLAARGTAFTHAHIPSGTSGAVCMPSRAMLHTGRSLYHIEGAGQSIPPDHAMLGETFRENGYRTFGTGKWHNGTASYARSFTDGGEIFFGGMEDHWNVPACRFDPTGAYDRIAPKCEDPYHGKGVRTYACDHVTPGKHSSELFCDAAISFLESVGDDPFFAYVSFMAPHDPRVMPDRFREMYDPDAIELPPNFMRKHPFVAELFKGRDENLAAHPRDPAEIREHIADYYAMISHLDHEMGRVLDALDKAGRADDTIIVFAGDNGLALGQHSLMGKQNCYEHSNRVPLLFAGPGIPAGQRRDAYVYLFDIFPTLCDLACLDIPATVEGQSLVPALEADERIRDHLFFGYCDNQRAVKDRRYKLIEFALRGRRFTQLFDLEQDPWETHDLSADPAHRERLTSLQDLLRQTAREWDDFDSPWGRTFWSRMEGGNSR